MKEAKRSSSGFSNREVHKSKKTYRGRSFFDKQLNSEYSPNAKLIFLGLAFIAILIGGFALSQGPLFHSIQSGPLKSGFGNDPFSLIWSESCPNCSTGDPGNIPGWTALLGVGSSVTYGSAVQCSAPVPCFAVGSDTSNILPITTIARTRNSIGELGIANAKNLLINMTFRTTQSIMVPGVKWGFYLTINNTFPPALPGVAYDPTHDPSVAFVSEFQCVTTCNSAGTKTLLDTTYMLRTIGKADTIAGENNGCANYSGSVFDCTTSIFDPSLYTHSISSFNFTGSSTPSTTCPGTPPAGSGCSYVAMSQNAGINYYVYTQVLPWLGINTEQYYLGLYTMAGLDGSTADAVQWQIYQTSNTQSMFFGEYTIPACVGTNTCPTSPPQLDTGGFFGPIIKALISLGVFIAQNIINFLNFLNSIFAPLLAGIITGFGLVFTIVFNAIGGIFGDSSLGTQIGTFFSGLSSYLANTFSSAITFLSTAVTFLSNALSVLSAFFSGGNSFVGLWTNLLSGLASLITGLNGFLSVILYFYNLGVFGFNIIIIVLVGILAVSAVLDWIQTDNAVAGFIAIIMTFFLLYVLQTNNSSLNVIATNASILTSYQAAWNNTLFFVKLAPVLFFAMFMEWVNGMDEVQRVHGGREFMPNFQSMLTFDIMITTSIFKGGYWFFKEAFDLVSKGLAAIKGRWSPVEVAGTG